MAGASARKDAGKLAKALRRNGYKLSTKRSSRSKGSHVAVHDGKTERVLAGYSPNNAVPKSVAHLRRHGIAIKMEDL